jgi:hypothetical protein
MRDKPKILFVSMGNLHFFRWCEVIDKTKYDYYWFDILDGGIDSKRIPHINQKTGWKLRLNYPFRYTIKNKIPWLYNLFALINNRSIENVFKKYVEELKPCLIHSFELDISCKPIYPYMLKNKYKWLLSTWGSDVYFAQFNDEKLKELKNILLRVNYIINDCVRDYKICMDNGFIGEFLGVIPGGTGLDLEFINENTINWSERNLIVIKGYQGKYGRCIEILKALKNIPTKIIEFKIVVFSANEEVINFINSEMLDFQITYNTGIKHDDLIKLLCKSWLYIGNSISDGIPNTLIEAIVCGCLPIQSNPGDASAELIKNQFNGLLINEPENIKHITDILNFAIDNRVIFESGLLFNKLELSKKFDRVNIKKDIHNVYGSILNEA